MKFPNLVYISPGPHQIGGKTYGYRAVNNVDDLEAAAKAGYYPTPVLAVEQPPEFSWEDYAQQMGWANEKETPETPAEPVIPHDNDAPTRVELETKADQLGIKYTDKTKNDQLAEKVAKAVVESKKD